MVTNIWGNTPSRDATLIVVSPPAITIQPQDQNVNQTSNVVFSVEATGTPPPGYQWRRNGADISGATASNYMRSNVQPADDGSYSVVVSNIAGTVLSTDAVLTVNVPPAITAQPHSAAAAVGSNVTFTVTASGTSPLAYQWRHNGTNLAYATASAYTCNNAQPQQAGSYSVVVSNVAGVVNSDEAVLTVTQPQPPKIDWIGLTTEGCIQLRGSGDPGHYSIEATTNLAEWAELTNFTTTSATFQYTDGETNLTQRFYRARLIP
jgi:hypothetical protein